MKTQKFIEILLAFAFIFWVFALCPILGLISGWFPTACAILVWGYCGQKLIKKINQVFPEEEV